MSDTTDKAELLDADAIAKSINGFEQIAIRNLFRARLDQIAEDQTMFLRALRFVLAKREGMRDPDAFTAAMSLTLEEVVDGFDLSAADADEDEDAVAERDRQYAEFVIGCGLSFTVEQYMGLTIGQKSALLDAAIRKAG